MSITDEITRLQGAKSTLKTKLNAVNKLTDQIDDETIDEYGDFVDTISNNIQAAKTKLQTDLYNPSEYSMIAVAKGTNVTLNDTEEESLDDFKILGKTVQNGTPSPTNPVVIENVSGKNIAYLGWEGEFISRIGDSTEAERRTQNSRNCIWWLASAGYQEYDKKFMFRTNWKPNTSYTISFDIYSTDIYPNIGVEYTDGTTSPNFGLTAQTWTHKTITTDATKTIKSIRGKYGGGSSYIDLNTFQIEEGTTATTYETPNTVKIKRTDETSQEIYSFPIEGKPLLAGDYIDKEGIHRTKKQIIFNGTENWVLYSSKTKTFRVSLGEIALSGICSHYSKIKALQFDVDAGIYLDYSMLCIISDPRFSSVSSFKTWLQSNPITIEYVPENILDITPLTTAQQTVFNEILQDGTYEVVTTYTSEGNLAPDMEINYHKDLQPRLSQTIEDVTDILGGNQGE